MTWVLRASVVLAGLSGVAADGYDLGGTDAICWLTQIDLATDNPNGTLADDKVGKGWDGQGREVQ